MTVTRRSFLKLLFTVPMIPPLFRQPGRPRHAFGSRKSRERAKSIKFRRYSRLAMSTEPLIEGVAPTGELLAQWGYRDR